jgi:hypothetical protein
VGCGELVVAVLEILFVVEQLLLKFGDSFPQVFDFIGSGEACRAALRAATIERIAASGREQSKGRTLLQANRGTWCGGRFPRALALKEQALR